jgi:hypothetical protein
VVVLGFLAQWQFYSHNKQSTNQAVNQYRVSTLLLLVMMMMACRLIVV